MAQAWNFPILAGDKVSAALLSKVNDALETLRSLHSGASDPTVHIAYMLHVDTALFVVKQRNAGDSASNAILATNVKNHQDEPQIYIAAGLTGTLNYPLYAPGQAWQALELVILVRHGDGWIERHQQLAVPAPGSLSRRTATRP